MLNSRNLRPSFREHSFIITAEVDASLDETWHEAYVSCVKLLPPSMNRFFVMSHENRIDWNNSNATVFVRGEGYGEARMR